MAKYNYSKDNELRKALIDFIGSQREDETEEEYDYRRNLNYRAIVNDVTGSLGIWGIYQP